MAARKKSTSPKTKSPSRTPGASATEGDPSDDEPIEAVASEAELVDADDSEAVLAEPVGAEDGAADGDADDDIVEASEVEVSDVDDDVEADVVAPAKRATESRERGLERADAMTQYLREVQRHPLLTPEETQALAIRLVETGDPKAAAQLVTANLRLVVKIAYEYRRAYKNMMDLVQEGNIGLMQAVKRYDPYRGVKLSSYSAWWIRAYILRYILNNWRLVKLGTTQAQRKLFFNLRKKRAELQAMGIEPTDEEVAKRLNVSEAEVSEMEVRLQASEKSLDAPVGDSEGRSTARVDMIPSVGEGPEALLAGGELQALLEDKLAAFRKGLAGRDKDLAIFDERLVAEDPLTLQELGDRFGVSRERVRQLEQRLTGQLREYLHKEMGDATEVA
ncbi:MAG: RNA polymerase factor sigma-32 [Polyangiaceae bacterium]